MAQAALTEHTGALDSVNAWIKLRDTRQKRGQSYLMFADELHTLASQAYPDTVVTDPLIQRNLVDIFTGGISDSEVRAHLVRHPPDTLEAAIKAANGEAQILERIRMYNTS